MYMCLLIYFLFIYLHVLLNAYKYYYSFTSCTIVAMLMCVNLYEYMCVYLYVLLDIYMYYYSFNT